jgi:hypothetical protein
MEGKINKLENNAIINVKETKKPNACVPPKDDAINIAKPKNNTIEEYIILTPVSLRADIMLSLMLNFFNFN